MLSNRFSLACSKATGGSVRIERLHLLAYGRFRDVALHFGAPGMHLVFGRNEAGKSTTLRAITSLLYGIDTRTRDAHLHKPADLRVGGTLVSDDGVRIDVVRRKGVSKGGPNTLLDERGRPLDEVNLQRMLRGVSEETFKHAFGLDHETLAKGAEALLSGRGDVGGSLFDASAGGGGDVRRLLAELEAEAEGIYKPRGTTLPLNAALKSFIDLQKAVKEKECLPAAYVLQQSALQTARQKHRQLVLLRSDLVRKRAQIDGARMRVPLQQKRALALQTLKELAEIASSRARIASLHSSLAAYELARAHYQDDAAKAERLRITLEDAALRAGLSLPVHALRLDARIQSRIQKLVQERGTLAERLDNSRNELSLRTRELERLQDDCDLARRVSAVKIAALARALEQARKLGDATALVATQLSRAARKKADVVARAIALGGTEEKLEEFVALPVPSARVLEEMAARAVDLDRTASRHADRANELAMQAEALEQQLAAASGDFAPPTAADLRSARQERDRLWRCVRDAAPDERAELAVAFERAVGEADSVVDQMLASADRVTALARCRAQQRTLAVQREQAEANWEAAKRERAALEEEHRLLWKRVGIERDDVGLPSMRTWLAEHAQLVSEFALARELACDAAETETTITAAASALAAALADCEGFAEDGSAKTLAALIDVATVAMDQIDAARLAATTSASLRAQLDERVSRAKRDEEALLEVTSKLEALVAPLGIPKDASGEEILQALDTLREVFALESQHAALAARIATTSNELASFESEVALAAKTLAADLVGLAPSAVVRELDARSKRAEAAEQSRAEAEAQLAEIPADDTAESELGFVASDPDQVRRELEDLDARLLQLEEQVTNETRVIARIEMGLDQMHRDSGAAEASALSQEALARARAELERYVRAKAAATLLGREIERYRQENQGPMLTMASQFFARLTLGSFCGVRAGYDDKDRPTLFCLRDGNVEVDVAGLSEGTRDQLYLSLRLASLQRYAEMSEPMPLVLDDVLIQFDDERSRAALTVLGDLSSRMQVFFFTHHARMVDLAREVVPASWLTVHELPHASLVVPQGASLAP